MNRKTSKCLKYFVVLVSAALIVESFVSAGARSILGAAVGPQGTGKGRPVITLKRLKESTALGNALLQIQFPNNERAGKQFTLTTADGARMVFRDDGKGGDERGDDGVLSSPLKVNFDQLAANQDRILGIHRSLNADLSVPRFEGRLRVGDTPLKTSSVDTLVIDDGSGSGDPVATSLGIDPARSLLITDLSVIEDTTRTFNPCTGQGNPTGKWTFGHLMTQMANQTQTGIDPRVFVRNWLAKFEAAQTINTFGVPARPNVHNIITVPWELASGGVGAPLDLTKAPFRLLAIVNRIDLRGNSGYTQNNAGEARFVFGAIDRRPNVGNCCTVTEMTVIFEYGIDKNGCAGVKAWAQEWVNLSGIPFGSQYNQALENITQQFVTAGAAPGKVNGSALNQLRTNEFLQPQPQWELREFRLTPGSEDPFVANGQLNMTTVKLTPDESFNNSPTLGQYLNQNFTQVCAGQHIVPLNFGNGAFLGGNAFAAGAGPAFWDSPAFVCPPDPNCDVEFNFSFNTCQGCHLNDTGTVFYHIRPTPFGSAPALSNFLRLTFSQPDARCGATFSHGFDELNRRRVILDQIANQTCPTPCTGCICEIEETPAALICPAIDIAALSSSEIVFVSEQEAVMKLSPGFVH